jgi:hypothetical protein
LNREQKEAWMLGYQEGYCNGYDAGCEKAYEEGFSKINKTVEETKIEFLKVRCPCGFVILHPVLKYNASSEFKAPEDEKCPSCGGHIPKATFARAYSEYLRSRR